MNKLSKYMYDLEEKGITEISKNLLNDYKKFGYKNDKIFQHHILFLLDNCFNFRLTDENKIRLNQKEFRKEIIKKYDGKCIITQNDCLDELEAAHIIPVSEIESYDVDNGLLLTSNLHKSMDKLLWSINPDSLIIEINPNKNVGQIKQYSGMKVDLKLTHKLCENLKWHHDRFISCLEKN